MIKAESVPLTLLVLSAHSLWHVLHFPWITYSVERKEDIEKVEEKERLQKEKEEKERKEAELAAQPGKGDTEEKTDDSKQVEGSTNDEGIPEVPEHDENAHDDGIGTYKDFPTDEVSFFYLLKTIYILIDINT